MEILRYPHPVLKKPSSPVLAVSEEDRSLLEQMLSTMYSNHGVGLAAPQVGINKKIIVVDIGDKNVLRLINPVIMKAEGREEMEEGCLSVPNIYVNVKRAKSIKVKAFNENGQTITLEVTGFLARAILHEIDHLNGKLIIDHLNPIKRIRVLNENDYFKK
jgi:peptide deformylase